MYTLLVCMFNKRLYRKMLCTMKSLNIKYSLTTILKQKLIFQKKPQSLEEVLDLLVCLLACVAAQLPSKLGDQSSYILVPVTPGPHQYCCSVHIVQIS